MPRFYGSLHGFKLPEEFSKTFDSALQIIVRQAARAWLRAVITAVPTWTGFALGSIKFAKGPNGDLARYLNVSVPISPRSDRPKWYYHNDGRKVPKIPERAGTFAQYNFPTAQHRYRFSFRDDVVHYILNEFYHTHPSPTSPWNSLQLGEQAFKDYIHENIQYLPRIKDYIVKVEIPFGK